MKTITYGKPIVSHCEVVYNVHYTKTYVFSKDTIGVRILDKKISIGLLGLGTVGSGVVKLIHNHQEQLVHQVGCPVEIKKVLVRDINKKREVQIDESKFTQDAYEVVHDPDIDVIVEVIGGVEKAREYILAALEAKKHVVTANKDLIALYGSELEEIASHHGCDLLYEASVAGGIPILRGLADGLVSDKIQKVMGIVNGTTNYILTKMDQDGISYEKALADAQALGFAEADPTADVDGIDAARKMTILARLAFSMNIDLDDVSAEGIANISRDDLKYGKTLGYTMKLIGYADRDEDGVEVSVQPAFLPTSHPLSAVNDEFNAVYVYGEAVGETMFYGPGAGSLPTATAVVSDIIAVLKNLRLGVNGRNALLPQFEKELKEKSEKYAKYYLRLHVKEKIGTLAEITQLFSENGVSFEKILQLPLNNKEIAEIIIVTHHASQADYNHVFKKLEELQVVANVKSCYRVEGVSE